MCPRSAHRGGQDRRHSREYGDTTLCWYGYFKAMTRSTPIRSSLKHGVCALLNLALLGCSGRMLTVNIINHGPPLHSVVISVPLVLPQNRHPERSAAQIDRLTQRLWRGVEEQ